MNILCLPTGIDRLFSNGLVTATKNRLAELKFTFDKKSLAYPLSILDDHKLPYYDKNKSKFSGGYIELSNGRHVHFESHLDTYCGYLMLSNSFARIKNIMMFIIIDKEISIYTTIIPVSYREYIKTFSLSNDISNATIVTIKTEDFTKYDREVSPDLPVTSFPAPSIPISYGPMRKNPTITAKPYSRCALPIKKAEKISDAIFAKGVYKNAWITRVKYQQIRDEIISNRPELFRKEPILEVPLLCDNPDSVKDYHALKLKFLSWMEQPEWDKNVYLNIEDTSSFEWLDGHCCCST